VVSVSGARATRALVPHPDHPARALRRLSVDVTRAPEALAVAYTLEGDLDALRIPAPAAPAIVHGLWEHTCFELFIAADGAAVYHELNLAPSGAWAAFEFRGYRDGGPVEDETLAPRIAVRRGPDRLLLEASVPLARVAPAYAGARLRLALTAVVEDVRGGRSYWALRHPPGRPDFHHRDGFALVLET
jgi:hypothetical protein